MKVVRVKKAKKQTRAQLIERLWEEVAVLHGEASMLFEDGEHEKAVFLAKCAAAAASVVNGAISGSED